MSDKITKPEIDAAYAAVKELFEPADGDVKVKANQARELYEVLGIDEESVTQFARERANVLAQKVSVVNPLTAQFIGLSEDEMFEVFVLSALTSAFIVGLQAGRTESGFTWAPTS